MATLYPPPITGQRSSSTVSTASMYSISDGEGSYPQQSRQEVASPTYQYRVENTQTIYVESTCPPHQWDEQTRLGINRQLSSAPEEVSTTVMPPSPARRRPRSWGEEAPAGAPETPSRRVLTRAPSRSLSSSPAHPPLRAVMSQPLACMPGMRASSTSSPKDLFAPSSASNAIGNRAQKTPSPTSRRPIRRRIYFYNREDPYYGLTNFSDHKVSYKGKIYPTSEHLFQSFKFQDSKPMLAEHIRLFSDRPSDALSEARRFQPEVRADWKNVNIQKMEEVLWHKFNQHKDLKQELLDTGDAELIEDSDKDSFWGIGADRRGRNELGKALERLRDRLRSEMT